MEQPPQKMITDPFHPNKWCRFCKKRLVYIGYNKCKPCITEILLKEQGKNGQTKRR